MAIPLALIGAQAGMSLWQARGQTRTAARTAGMQTYQALTEQHLQEMQTERQWETQSRLRSERLRSVLASQRATYASRGIVGGRSARLAEMESRRSAMREQGEADFARRMGFMTREYGTQQRIRGARTTASQQARQAQIDLFSDFIGLGMQTHEHLQARGA